MTAGDELSYAFVRPSPFTKAMLKFTGGMGVVGSAAILALWGAEILSPSDTAAAGLFLLAFCAVLAISFLLQERAMAQAILRPAGLQIKRRSAPWHDYPWQDVASVSVETWSQAGLADRAFWAIFGRPDLPYAKIVLQRAIRFPQWGTSPISTRGWGIFVPGLKTLRLYLTDAEGFVRDAQRFQQRGGPSRE